MFVLGRGACECACVGCVGCVGCVCVVRACVVWVPDVAGVCAVWGVNMFMGATHVCRGACRERGVRACEPSVSHRHLIPSTRISSEQELLPPPPRTHCSAPAGVRAAPPALQGKAGSCWRRSPAPAGGGGARGGGHLHLQGEAGSCWRRSPAPAGGGRPEAEVTRTCRGRRARGEGHLHLQGEARSCWRRSPAPAGGGGARGGGHPHLQGEAESCWRRSPAPAGEAGAATRRGG